MRVRAFEGFAILQSILSHEGGERAHGRLLLESTEGSIKRSLIGDNARMSWGLGLSQGRASVLEFGLGLGLWQGHGGLDNNLGLESNSEPHNNLQSTSETTPEAAGERVTHW